MASALPTIPFAEAVTHRHSVYTLTDKLPAGVTNDKISAMVAETLKSAPSPFNNQATRIVLLVGAEHKKFWGLAREITVPSLPEAMRDSIAGRISAFEGAYGSIIFAEDGDTLAASKQHNPAIAALFDEWSDHSSGMHQFILWAGIEALPGVGASLQHYQWNPALEKAIKETWGLPEAWKFKAQLVFGEVTGEWPAAKEKKPTSETLKVFGA